MLASGPAPLYGEAMLRRVVGLGSILALTACKPTIIHDPDLGPRPTSDPAGDPLVEHEAVRVCVREYVAAAARRDVEAASKLVVGETFHYYENLRIAALQETREQLERWDLLSLVSILQIRHKVGRAQLEVLDGRGLFGIIVREGWAGIEGLDEVSFDEVQIDETGKTARILLDGVPMVWLRKTNDDGDQRWRMDFPEMFRALGLEIEASAREQVLADGRLRTAYTWLVLSSDESIAIEILDGPLE